LLASGQNAEAAASFRRALAIAPDLDVATRALAVAEERAMGARQANADRR
jgi:hypothetical protein